MPTMILSDIIKHYNPVYPDKGTWEDTVSVLMNSPTDARVVNRLKEIISEGKLREPISIGTGEDKDGTQRKFVFNGTHRVVAYILLGYMDKDVLVLDEDKETVPYNPEETIAFTSFTFDKDIDDEFFCHLIDNLISFELNEDFWVEGDFSGRKSFNATWLLSYNKEKELLPDIHDKACDIVKTLGYTNVSVESYWETWTGDTVETVEKEVIKTSYF